MKFQTDEKVIHELKPDSKVLGLWFFTKCIPATLISAFLSFWFFGFFGGMFCAATKSNSAWPLATGGITAIIIAPAILILSIIYCKYLQKTHTYYITNQRCIFKGGYTSEGRTICAIS